MHSAKEPSPYPAKELCRYRANRLSRGFTLIEVVIAIGVISIVSVIGAVNYVGSKQRKSLDAAISTVISEVRGAMESSRSQESGAQKWISFENPVGQGNDFYRVCSGTYNDTPATDCAAEGGVETSRVKLKFDLDVVDPPQGESKNVVISKGAGLPVETTEIIVKSVNGGIDRQRIIINSNGRIDLNYIPPSILSGEPMVVTALATSVNETSAILNGSVTPNGASTLAWFRYSATNPGSCDDNFGTSVPSDGTAVGSGSEPTPYSENIDGLTDNITYYYCAIAINSEGVSYGAVVPFTASLPPEAVTSPATSITAFTATLNGSGNPQGVSATGYFRYSTTDPSSCNDTFGIRAPLSSGTGLGSGTGFTAFSRGLSGLSANTIYYFCAIVTNSAGIGLSPTVLSFTTSTAPPTVTTNAATSITDSLATLNGLGNPNGLDANGWFRYHSRSTPGTCTDTDAFGTRIPSSSGADLGAENSDVGYSQGVPGLSPSTTYYFCAIASNTIGTGLGSVLSFATMASSPTVTTSAATGIATSTVTLNGSANPNGASTTGYFRYSTTNPGTCSDTFGTRVPLSGGTNLGAGTSSVPFSQAISGLTAGTTYYFCAIANSAGGTALGSVLSFTVYLPPATITLSASESGLVTVKDASISPGRLGLSCVNSSLNDKIYCFGGFSSQGEGFTYYNQVVEYDPLTDTSVTKSAAIPSSNARSGLSCAEDSSTNKIYCFGGKDGGAHEDDIIEYNPADDTLVTKSAVLPGPRSDLSCAENSTTHKIYCFGGHSNFDGGNATVNQIVAYDPSNDTISVQSATLPSARAALSCVERASTHKTYCLGGYSYGVVNQIVEYDPASDTVAVKSATLPGYGAHHSCTENSSNQYIYCFGGFDGEIAEYDPVNDITTPLPAVLPVPNQSTSCTISSANQNIYCFDGYDHNANNEIDQIVEYDPFSVSAIILRGSANPNGASTTGYFRYSTTNPGTCSDTFGTRVPLSGGTNLGAGTSSVPFSQAISGLTAGTTYYFCAIAVNSAGMVFGSVVSFTQP